MADGSEWVKQRIHMIISHDLQIEYPPRRQFKFINQPVSLMTFSSTIHLFNLVKGKFLHVFS